MKVNMKTRVKKGLLYGFMGLMLGISSLPEQVSADSASPEIVWQKEAGDEQFQLTGILQSSNHQLSIGGLNGDYKGYPYEGRLLAYLSRWDDQGNLIWSRNITLDNPNGDKPVIITDVSPTKDGGYLLRGTYPAFFFRYDEHFVAKVDQNGDKLWAQTVTYGGYDKVTSAVELNDGGTVYTPSYGFGKISASGQIEWTKAPSNNSESFQTTNADVTPEGEVIVSGNVQTVSESGNIESALKLWKLSQSGETLWIKGLPFPGHVKAVNDGYLVTSTPNSGSTQIQILKLDKTGNKLWGNSYDFGEVNQVSEDKDGYLLATDRGLFQIDASGKLLWSKDLGKKVAEAIQIGDKDIYALTGNKLVKLAAANSGGSDNPGDPVSSLKFDSEEYSISLGDTFDTVVTWYAQDGQAVNVSSDSTYSSSRPDVLTIDAQGNITGISRGTAVITAKYGDQTVSALVNVY
ncbi:Bacterial Ig-like domain (group 2) [compost metagenome]